MAGDLSGQVILVTGAARRVGAEIACALHGAGARVAIHYRSAAGEAQALAGRLNAALPDSACCVGADLRDVASLPRLIETVIGRFGRLDALVNNASSFFATPLGAIGDAEYDDLMGSNLKGPLFLTQAAAGHLEASAGCVVNIVDIHADRPLKNYPVYCAAKAGLVGLTRALALELAPRVRVNGVAPGPILWPESEDFDATERHRIVERTPLGRTGAPGDIAAAVRYLIAEAPYVTGQILAVDGGRTIRL